MSFSNRPKVFGFVNINTAVSSPTTFFKSSTSTKPFSFVLRLTTSKPASDAEAGFVPCAESGTITYYVVYHHSLNGTHESLAMQSTHLEHLLQIAMLHHTYQ